MSAELAGYAHNYLPGDREGSGLTLLLLHGTGGNEDDLIPLGQQLLPGAAILSPRGKVSEHGAPRFFRRLAEGVFDHEDLLLRTHELADFVDQAADQYGFDSQKLVARGSSRRADAALGRRRHGARAGARGARGPKLAARRPASGCGEGEYG